MPNLQLIYIAGFNTDMNTGRNNATRNKRDAFREQIGVENFKFYQPWRSSLKFVSYLYACLFDTYILTRILFISRNTIVLQRQTILPLSNLILRFRKIKMVYELHTDLESELIYLGKSRIEKWFIRILIWSEKLNLRMCSGIVINSPTLKKYIEKYRKPNLCIYNGANTKDFFPKDKWECRQKLGLRSDYKYFLFSGMVSKWHGTELLINAWKEGALASRFDYVLLVVGTSNNAYSDSLKSIANGLKNVQFVNFMPVDLLNTYINAADICLLPVNDIRSNLGSPLKLYDYISCGKPVITQIDTPGYSDEITAFNLGKTTDFLNRGSLADVLMDAALSLDLNFYRINNVSKAGSDLSWTKRIEEWIRFFNNLSFG